MDFEYDPRKSEANRKKHGINFEEAKEIWSGPSVEFAAKEEFENRFAILGPVRGKLFMKKASRRPSTAEEFDAHFEAHDISDLLDVGTKRVNLDIPTPILRRLDLKAHELGLTRQALVKYWIAERLELLSKH